MRTVLATVTAAFVLALGPVGIAAAGSAQTPSQTPSQTPTPTSSPSSTDQVAPEYQSSEPSDGDMMHEAPQQVKITFSEPLDPSSTVMVHDECGRAIDDGNVEVVGTDMTVGIAKTPVGLYTVMYTAVGLGGVTGETDGDFSFMVHAGESCDGSDGGHDGHGGHGGGHGGHGGGHGGHGGGHGSGSHEGHGSTEHSGHSSEHSTHDTHGAEHTDHNATHDGHATGHAHGHSEHSGKHHHGGKHGGGSTEPPPVAAAIDPPVPLAPNSQAVLAALLMSLGFGVLGGWYLRTSARR